VSVGRQPDVILRHKQLQHARNDIINPRRISNNQYMLRRLDDTDRNNMSVNCNDQPSDVQNAVETMIKCKKRKHAE